jgi:hypothetical protein
MLFWMLGRRADTPFVSQRAENRTNTSFGRIWFGNPLFQQLTVTPSFFSLQATNKSETNEARDNDDVCV